MSQEITPPIVIVTGASSGIGRAIAVCVAQAGYEVFAGVRSDSATQSLEREGLPNLRPVLLDIAEPRTIAAAIAAVQARAAEGPTLLALINNAAICVASPLESVPLEDLQQQFAVNVLGTVALTQAALPLLRQARGRIVNIGSNVGRLPPPFLGPYAASKAALEALTECWRRELRAFGVQVSLVIPGPVMTPVWRKLEESSAAQMELASPEVRARYQRKMRKFFAMNYETARGSGVTSNDVAAVVLRCLRARSPKLRYEIGFHARLATWLSRGLPSRWVDAAIDTTLKPDGVPGSQERPLGGIERAYYFFNAWSANNVVAICELDGVFDSVQLERALHNTLRRYPILQRRVVVDPGGRNPRFALRDETGGILAIEACAQLDRDALTTRELNRLLDPQHALIRVAYAHEPERSVLIVTLLHIISDATSVMLVLRALLEEIEHPQGRETEARSSQKLQDSLDALLPGRTTGMAGIPLLLRTQLNAFRQARSIRPARLPAQADLPLSARRNAYTHRMLDLARVDALKQACAAQSVSVHGLLTAALALAVADELGLRDRPDAVLNIGSPVSIREALDPALIEELGSYVCTLGLPLRVGSNETCWTVALQVNQEIAQRRAADEALATLNLIKYLCPKTVAGSERMLRYAEQHGPGNVCISNIGEFALPRRVKNVSVRSAHWSAPLSVTGYVLCAVCTTSHGLALDFTYVEELVTAARAKRIITAMLANLSHASASQVRDHELAAVAGVAE